MSRNIEVRPQYPDVWDLMRAYLAVCGRSWAALVGVCSVILVISLLMRVVSGMCKSNTHCCSSPRLYGCRDLVA